MNFKKTQYEFQTKSKSEGHSLRISRTLRLERARFKAEPYQV